MACPILGSIHHMKLLLILASSFLLAACSTSHSTLKEGKGYAITREQAAEITHQSLSAHMSADRITTTDKSGLSASGYMRYMLDTHTINVSAFPMRGTDPAGVVREGYAFQVYGTGTMLISGSLRTRRVYDTVKTRAGAIGTPLRP